MRPAQNHKRIKIILIRLIVINLFLSGIKLDRGSPIRIDRGGGISSDRGINLDRGAITSPNGRPSPSSLRIAHASTLRLILDNSHQTGV